jgi:hypothetical protein
MEEAMEWEVIEHVGGHVWALADLDARGYPRAEEKRVWKGAVEPNGHALRLAKEAHPNLDLIARHLPQQGLPMKRNKLDWTPFQPARMGVIR